MLVNMQSAEFTSNYLMILIQLTRDYLILCRKYHSCKRLLKCLKSFRSFELKGTDILTFFEIGFFKVHLLEVFVYMNEVMD